MSGEVHDAALRLHALLPARGSLAAAFVAMALLTASAVLKPLLEDWSGETLPPYILSYPAVVVAALVAGCRIGVLAALASVVLAWSLYLPPLFSLAIRSRADLLSIGIYALTSTLLALACGFARTALDLAVASEQQRDYDAREAVHRIKNMLAVVQAVTSGTTREAKDLADYDRLISGRLSALAAAQDLLLRRSDGPAQAQELITAAVAPFLPDPRIALDCDDRVLVPARYVHGLSLALFELATNSAKHGALGSARGSVALVCRREGELEVLRWTETIEGADHGSSGADGPGFGSKLIQIALRGEPGTSVTHDRSGGTVEALFSWPSPPSA